MTASLPAAVQNAFRKMLCKKIPPQTTETLAADS
jgi:hypothetical protein